MTAVAQVSAGAVVRCRCGCVVMMGKAVTGPFGGEGKTIAVLMDCGRSYMGCSQFGGKKGADYYGEPEDPLWLRNTQTVHEDSFLTEILA